MSKITNIGGTEDVYETKDVPIPEYNQSNRQDSNVIEEIQLDMAAVKEKFAKDKLGVKHVDFSDNVAKISTGGYSQVEYELLSCTTNETPIQRYQRLKMELNEFSEDLKKLSEESEDNSNTVKLAGEVRKLTEDLAEMKVEKMIGKLKVTEPGHSVLTKQLNSQLSAFKEKSAKEGGKAGVVTYEIHYRGDHAKFAEAAKLAALEKRIASLETTLGKDLKILSTISGDTPSSERNILGLINNIQTKLSLIEPSDYTHIDTRLQAILHKMDDLKEKAKKIPEANNKVTEVFDMVRKVEPVISTLPDIVNRLTALKALHSQAATFSSNLSTIETTQNNLTKNLSNQSALLKKVEDNISNNLEQISGNCNNLNERIDKLSSKIEKSRKK